jgi:type I restriction enzyme S subunit
MSDVPEGYKMSEVGVIPEEWEVKSLDNIGSFKKGKNIPKKDLTLEGVPCVLYGEIYTKYNFTSKKLSSFIPLAIAQQSTSINKGDILFAGSGETADEIGKCFTYLGDEKACAGGDINVLSPFNDDSTFLGYLLNSPQVNKQKSNLGQGSSVVHIYSSSLKTILIPTPPLSEQQAIASALSDVDAFITALEQLITKKRNIKQGTMQQLLAGKKRLPGVSGEWEVKKLGEIVTFSNGKAHENSISENGQFIVINSKFISTEGDIKKYSDSCLCPVSIGEIVMVMSDVPNGKAISKCFYIDDDEKYTLNQRICSLKALDDDSKFLFYLINRHPYYLTFDDGVKQTNLRKDDVLGCPLKMPLTLKEQQAIAQILSDMDTEIEALEQKQDKYKAIKHGMMQELLTGKRRLA